MRCRVAPADRDRLAKDQLAEVFFDGRVLETRYQALESVVVYATSKAAPGILSIAVLSPLTRPERSIGASKSTGLSPSWRGAGGDPISLLCGSRAMQVHRCFSAVLGTGRSVDLSHAGWLSGLPSCSRPQGLAQEECGVSKTCGGMSQT
jgi:hypothetical protein